MSRIILTTLLLLASGSVSMAYHRPYSHYQTYSAHRLHQEQRAWPNVALCDDGGYRIRPCDISPGRR
jgi:hypothetical protein